MDDFADKIRSELSEHEKTAARAILRRFQSFRDRIEKQFADLIAKLEAGKQAGFNFDFLLYQKRYLLEILADVQSEINRIAPALGEIVEQSQVLAMETGRNAIAGSNRPELSTRIRFFDLDSTREIAGFTADGTPLADHFKKLAIPIQQTIFQTLTDGIGFGRSNAAIAAELKRSTPKGLFNALTTARTETNRAYRETTRKFLTDVPGVIGYRWIAALDLRTCPICWSRHGKLYRTSTPFDTHPNCRCTMIAVFDGDPPVERGSEKFAKLSPAGQRAILGSARFDLYQSGVKLSDFIATRQTPFGKTPFLKPLSSFDPIPKPKPPIPDQPKKVKIEKAKPKPPAPSSSKFPDKFATTKQAQTWLENKFPAIQFDLTGVSPKLVHEIAAEFNRLADKFPEVVARLEYFGTYKDTSKKFNRRRGYKVRPQAFAHASTDGKRIGLNPRWFSSPTKIAAALKDSAESGWLVSGRVDSIITHEFGHQIDNWLGSTGQSLTKLSRADGRTEISSINEKIREKFKLTNADQVSKYALKNGDEQFAESYSQATYKPKSLWSRYTKAQKALIDYVRDRNNPRWIYADQTDFRSATDDEKDRQRKIEKTIFAKFGLDENGN